MHSKLSQEVGMLRNQEAEGPCCQSGSWGRGQKPELCQTPLSTSSAPSWLTLTWAGEISGVHQPCSPGSLAQGWWVSKDLSALATVLAGLSHGPPTWCWRRRAEQARPTQKQQTYTGSPSLCSHSQGKQTAPRRLDRRERCKGPGADCEEQAVPGRNLRKLPV